SYYCVCCVGLTTRARSRIRIFHVNTESIRKALKAVALSAHCVVGLYENRNLILLISKCRNVSKLPQRRKRLTALTLME
ncbi:unnamed protein product, partial [Allacma fusca]